MSLEHKCTRDKSTSEIMMRNLGEFTFPAVILDAHYTCAKKKKEGACRFGGNGKRNHPAAAPATFAAQNAVFPIDGCFPAAELFDAIPIIRGIPDV